MKPKKSDTSNNLILNELKKVAATMEERFNSVDKRFETVDQRFESMESRMATKDDLKNFATKDDLKNFATKDDLKNFATKDDIANIATKDDIVRLGKAIDVNAESIKNINEYMKAHMITKEEFKIFKETIDKYSIDARTISTKGEFHDMRFRETDAILSNHEDRLKKLEKTA